MEYFVGVAIAIGVGAILGVAGFERDRALYPIMLIVIASYYDLFAVIGGGAALGGETLIFGAFVLTAVIGFRTTLWIVVAALIGHGVLDFYHGRLIANAGVPAWWPMFCASFDVAAGVYLACRLGVKGINASNPLSFGNQIRVHVEGELRAGKAAEAAGDPSAAFRHLERAHVLSQQSTVQHIGVHVAMLMWAVRQRDRREVMGQLGRMIGAAATTAIGLAPHGNTGGANVSAFKSMAIADDLASIIDAARAPIANPNR